MIKKSIFFYFQLFVFTTFLQEVKAQEIEQVDLYDNLSRVGNALKSSQNMATGIAYDNRFEGTKGTPYWFDDWCVADVDFIGFKSYENVALKYDVVNEKVILKISSDSIEYVVEPEIIERFTVNYFGNNFKFSKIDRNLFLNPQEKTKFYRVVYDGQIAVIQEVLKVLIKADFKGGYASGETYDQYVKKENYFLLYPKGKFKPFELKQKSVAKCLPKSEREKFNQYFEKNKVKLKTEQILIQALSYLEKN